MKSLFEWFKIITFILSVMLISLVSSADTVIKYGANVPSDSEKMGRTKAIFISQQQMVFPHVGANWLITQYEIGAWFDNSGINGRSSSSMGSVSAGINVNTGYIFGQALVGPALISAPDSNLGGVFQFNNDVAFGLRDPDTNATFGFAYKHLSSAGIESPNRGRDFMLFRISIPLE